MKHSDASLTPEPGDGFAPSWLIRHSQIQSILATKGPRRRLWLKRGNRMEAVQTRHVLDCRDGVKLTGLHSRQPEGGTPRGLVVLIHGWEGSHESVYLYSMSCALYQAGYNIFRLNLRDHGGTHALNREMFHSARFDEVLEAIAAVQALDATQPLFVIGFSLGGNFALRVALRGPAQGIKPKLTIGISPAINPAATTINRNTLNTARSQTSRNRNRLRPRAAWRAHGAFTSASPLTTLSNATNVPRLATHRQTRYAAVSATARAMETPITTGR